MADMGAFISPIAWPAVSRAWVLAALVTVSVACGGQAPVSSPTPTEVPTATPPPSLEVVLSRIVTPTPTVTPAPTPAPEGAEYYDSYGNMFRIFASRPNHPVKVAMEGVQQARVNKDASQVPIILEVMRFFPSQEFQMEANAALRALTGQPPEGVEWTWQEWMEWLGANATEFRPPEGYADWKSVIMTVFDPRYRELFPPGAKTANVDLTEVIWSGVVPDSSTDLQFPEHVTADAAGYLVRDDRVFGVSINGEHRAYPLRIMNLHEIANDLVGGESVVLVYCTLCGAGMVYKAEVNGSPATFGTSGLIYRSDPVMFDRVANTLWLQYTGQPIMGDAADPGVSLDRLPMVLTTWEEWVDRHPDTTVLSGTTAFFGLETYVPESTPGSPLRAYESSDDTIFPVWNRSDALGLKEMVLGVGIDGHRKAYPAAALQQAVVVNDTVGATEIVAVASPGSQAARVYKRGDRQFARAESDSEDGGTPRELVDGNGALWRVTEEALVNDDDPSRTLTRLATHMSYWFAWYAFYPDTLVYVPEGP